MKVDGIPDGWELVRIGIPNIGEWIIASDGELHVVSKYVRAYCYPIIRKVEKPKQYRPFANAQEFTPHRDRWCKIGVCESRVLNVNQQHVYFRDMSFTWEQAFIEIIFDDGTPFGVEVTE
jgi:hypothetical protein